MQNNSQQSVEALNQKPNRKRLESMADLVEGHGKTGPRPRGLLVRFKEKYAMLDNGCWQWTAGKTALGYATISVRRYPYRASRVSWIMAKGDIPAGMDVLHSCDNRACVNPAHLFLGTPKDNSDDCHSKRRHRFGIAHPNSKLDDAAVVAIFRLAKSGFTQIEIAARMGVDRANISYVTRRKTWAHVAIPSSSVR